jgi:Arc/MetJ family transcription regulator
MRTNIEIDDALLAEAMAATGLKTEREVVEAGLRLLARYKRQTGARQLFGRVQWEGDLESAWTSRAMRSASHEGARRLRRRGPAACSTVTDSPVSGFRSASSTARRVWWTAQRGSS